MPGRVVGFAGSMPRPSVPIAVALLGVGLTLGFWAPAFLEPHNTGFGDWHLFHNMWETGRVAIERHGEIALWNAFHCGGVTLWGNPQNQVLSPLFFVSLLVGSTLALKVHLVVHHFLGMSGMFVFARREVGLGHIASGLAAIAWACSGTFAWDGAGGHSTFLGFYLFPWLLFFYRRAADDPRFCGAVAATFLMLLLDGGTYTPPFAILFLAFDTAARLADAERRRGVVRAGVLCGLLTAMLGAVRAVPAMLTIRRFPRQDLTGAPDSVTFAEVIEMLTGREHEWRWGHEFVWAEYGAFIGWTVIALGLLGALVALRRRQGALVVGAALFGLYMVGNKDTFFPWTLTQHLPVFDNLRVPSRFAVLFNFFFALLAALALQELVDLLGRLRRFRFLGWVSVVVPALIVIGATVDIFLVNVPINDRWDGAPLYALDTDDRYYVEAGRDTWTYYSSLPRMNRGSRFCNEAIAIEIPRRLWSGPGPQARLEETGGRVIDWGRTSNTVWADVELEEPGTVLFNQRWAVDWESNVGQVRDLDHQLAVDAPAGRHRIEVRYFPREIPPLAALFVVGSLLALLNARWGTAARWAALGRALTPWRRRR